MNHFNLNLLFPQWQGSGDSKKLYSGAKEIKNYLSGKMHFEEIEVTEESPSHHFHGMPLRSLLGEGDKNIINSCFSTISSNQIYLIGGRDYDQAETEYIKTQKIMIYKDTKIKDNFQNLSDSISTMGFDNLYIHIDLDVLDPKVFPHVKCPAKGGLLRETLLTSLHSLKKDFSIVGLSVVEYTSKNCLAMDYIKEILKAGDFL